MESFSNHPVLGKCLSQNILDAVVNFDIFQRQIVAFFFNQGYFTNVERESFVEIIQNFDYSSLTNSRNSEHTIFSFFYQTLNQFFQYVLSFSAQNLLS